MQKQEEEKKEEFPEVGFSGIVQHVGKRALEMGVMGHNLEGKHDEFLEKASPWKEGVPVTAKKDEEIAEGFGHRIVKGHHTGFHHPFHNRHVKLGTESPSGFGVEKIEEKEEVK
jgi:hypothetical protein